MAIDRAIQAIRNVQSGKIFILIQADEGGKMTILNPEGKTLTVPGGLFGPPFLVSPQEAVKMFSAEQLDAFLRPTKRGTQPTKSASTRRVASGSNTSGRTATSKKSKTPMKTGLGAEWPSSQLTFYKHKIEPLSPLQTFRILLEDERIFTIAKEDFLRVFNDVVISKSYWEEGSFSYPEMPEKALKYIK